MMKYRWSKFVLIVAFATMIATIGLPGSKPDPISGLYSLAKAEAQEKKKRSLFSILFGKKKAGKKATRSSSKTRKKRNRQSKKRRSTTRRTVSSSAPAASANRMEKSEDAKIVLIVGDFFASRLSRGLQTGLADVPDIVVENKARGSSGFVRTDIINWPEKLPDVVEETKPAYIVVMLGSNDRQQMREDGKRLARSSKEWDEAYQKRVNSLGKSLAATGLPFTWVGLPPVRFNSMNVDFLKFNEWYRKAATDNGGQFVDVWDGFSDADGRYIRSGPDINGQIVLLRPKEGINLTKAGARRLAFYVEDSVKRALSGEGRGVNPLGESAPSGIGQQQYDPAATGRTPVINLADPAIDGADQLAGGSDRDRELEKLLPSATLASARKAPPLQRADNHRWQVPELAE